jgi:hypothetical protein
VVPFEMAMAWLTSPEDIVDGEEGE